MHILSLRKCSAVPEFETQLILFTLIDQYSPVNHSSSASGEDVEIHVKESQEGQPPHMWPKHIYKFYLYLLVHANRGLRVLALDNNICSLLRGNASSTTQTYRAADLFPFPWHFDKLVAYFEYEMESSRPPQKSVNFPKISIFLLHVFFFFSLLFCGRRSIATLSVIRDDANGCIAFMWDISTRNCSNLPLQLCLRSTVVLYVQHARGSSNGLALAVCGIPGETFINIQLGQQLERHRALLRCGAKIEMELELRDKVIGVSHTFLPFSFFLFGGECNIGIIRVRWYFVVIVQAVFECSAQTD